MSRIRVNNEFRKRGTSRTDSAAIKILTSKGGWVAQTLKAGQVDTKPERWDGRSGYEKAIFFGLKALEITPASDENKRGTLAKYIEMCTQGLFKKTMATEFEKTGENKVRHYTPDEAEIANDQWVSPKDKFTGLASIAIIDWGRYMMTPSTDPKFLEHIQNLADNQQEFVNGMANYFDIDQVTRNALALNARAAVHEIWSKQNPQEFTPTYPPSA